MAASKAKTASKATAAVTPARRPHPRGDRARRAAMDAAQAILLEEGWDAVTHARVAERSGLHRVTIYRHWQDRLALLNDILRSETIRAHLPLSGDLRRDLTAALQAIREELVDRQYGRVLAALIDRGEWDPEIHRIRVTQAGETVAGIRATLTAAVDDGTLLSGTDVDLAIAQLVGPLIYRRLISSEPAPPGIVESIVDGFLVGHDPR